jgi:riboflavin biosynthesis pyrimidine reductase
VEALEAEYLHPAGRHIRANFVTSIDGMVEVDGRSGALSGDADRDAFMAMRAVSDVILVGAGTVREERYGPVHFEAAVEDRRRARDQAPIPPLAIVSNRGDLDPEAKVFRGDDKPLLLTTEGAAAAHPDLAGVAEMVVCGDQWADRPCCVRSSGLICSTNCAARWRRDWWAPATAASWATRSWPTRSPCAWPTSTRAAG